MAIKDEKINSEKKGGDNKKDKKVRCPARTRTWTGRTKIYSATITPPDSTY